MCRCTPEMRTPFCGKPGCEWPKPKQENSAVTTRSTRLTVPSDMSIGAVADAAGMLGVMPEHTTLYCAVQMAAEAQTVRDKWRCNVILLPVELLGTTYHWALGHGIDFVWSPGV